MVALYPLAFGLGRLAPSASPVLRLEETRAVLTLGRRLLYRDDGPRATFLLAGSAHSGGLHAHLEVQGGAFAYVAAGEWDQPYLFALGGAFGPDERIAACSAVATGYPAGVRPAGLLASCTFDTQSGTDVQVVLGAPDAPPVADTWYALSVSVFSTTGRALQYTVPIMCPG